MKESTRSWTPGRFAEAEDTDDERTALDAAPLTLLLLPLQLALLKLLWPSLRPVTRSNEEGEMGDPSGVESGVEEADSEVLSLVVRVRKIGILKNCRCCCV